MRYKELAKSAVEVTILFPMSDCDAWSVAAMVGSSFTQTRASTIPCSLADGCESSTYYVRLAVSQSHCSSYSSAVIIHGARELMDTLKLEEIGPVMESLCGISVSTFNVLDEVLPQLNATRNSDDILRAIMDGFDS